MRRIYIVLCIAVLTLRVPAASEIDLSGKRLTLEFESVPLVSVLNMIAQQNELNMVVSDEVTGEVSVRLDNVDIGTALDAILKANGYMYFMRDNVIVVKPMAATKAEDLETRTVTLKYLDPATAKKAVVSRLSEKGQVVILDKGTESKSSGIYSANRILITDYRNTIDDLVALVAELDIPERSILIEARIIETKVDKDRRLGLNWPSAIDARLGHLVDASSSSTTTTTSTSGTYAGILDIESERWTWGKLSVAEMTTILDLLEQDGNSRLVSDPRITTVENHEARFQFQTVIPIQTINRFTEGAATSDIVTFEDEEVGISLTVTPRINEGRTITLDVEPTVEDIIGFNGPAGNQKPITASRSIEARITVEDGETVALGGLLKEDDLETVKRVPVLGHIPILGSLLFSHKSVERSTTDLIIMITPHILD